MVSAAEKLGLLFSPESPLVGWRPTPDGAAGNTWAQSHSLQLKGVGGASLDGQEAATCCSLPSTQPAPEELHQGRGSHKEENSKAPLQDQTHQRQW